jgi:hypothetical protein
MSKNDLRLRYVMANKELASDETLREMALRAFAASFCDDDNVATAEIVISALATALVNLAELKHQEVCDDLEDDQEPPPGPVWLSGSGSGAEDFYYTAMIRAYTDAGFDRKYAEEAAGWPDVLNFETRYPANLLVDFARLEVGHDLLVGDYLRATAANNYFKTEPLTAGETKSDGSAQ